MTECLLFCFFIDCVSSILHIINKQGHISQMSVMEENVQYILLKWHKVENIPHIMRSSAM